MYCTLFYWCGWFQVVKNCTPACSVSFLSYCETKTQPNGDHLNVEVEKKAKSKIKAAEHVSLLTDFSSRTIIRSLPHINSNNNNHKITTNLIWVSSLMLLFHIKTRIVYVCARVCVCSIVFFFFAIRLLWHPIFHVLV